MNYYVFLLMPLYACTVFANAVDATCDMLDTPADRLTLFSTQNVQNNNTVAIELFDACNTQIGCMLCAIEQNGLLLRDLMLELKEQGGIVLDKTFCIEHNITLLRQLLEQEAGLLNWKIDNVQEGIHELSRGQEHILGNVNDIRHVQTIIERSIGQIDHKADRIEDLIKKKCKKNNNNKCCRRILRTISKVEQLALSAAEEIDDLQDFVEQEFADVELSQAKVFSKIDQIEAELSSQSAEIDAVVSVVDNLQDFVEQEFADVELSQAKIFSKIDQIESLLASESAEIDAVVSVVDNLQDFVEQEFADVEASQAKIFSKIDQIEALLASESADIDAVVSVVDNLQDFVEQELADVEASQAIIFSKIDQIETVLTSEAAEIDQIASILDEIENLIEQEFADNQLSQEKIFSKIDEIENLLSNQSEVTQADIGSGTYTITTAGYYKLAESVTFNQDVAITINASNVTLDLNGNAIDGTGACCNIIGIVVNNAQNVVIKNGTVISGGRGIVVANGQSIHVENVTCFKNVGDAFVAYNIVDGSFTQCKSSSAIAGNGFMIESCSGILLHHCNAHYNEINGISCVLSENVQIIKNSIMGNQYSGVVIDANSTNIQVVSNYILGNGGIGLEDQGANNAMHVNNLSTGNGISYSGVTGVTCSKASSYWKNVQG